MRRKTYDPMVAIETSNDRGAKGPERSDLIFILISRKSRVGTHLAVFMPAPV